MAPVTSAAADAPGAAAGGFTRSILDHATEAILHVDAAGAIRGVNLAAERMFGMTEADLRGQRVDVLMPGASSRRHGDSAEPVPVTGPASRGMVGRRRDGRRFPMDFSVTPFSFDGEVHYTWIVRDVTERVRLEEQLHQSQKMEALGQLAGGVAHDVNNLLTVINGWCETLTSSLSAASPSPSPMDAVAQIAGAAAQAAKLTGQLLAFARKATVAPSVVDLNGVIADVDRMLRRVLGEDVTLEEDFARGSMPVRVDPGQMSQVLVNLAINARDAMPRGGRLRIATCAVTLDDAAASARQVRPGRYIQLAVSDTGCGMPADVRARVFEPFFTTKGPGRGTGLGLATVYGIVRQADGTIGVESEPGRGTTFTVLLPEVAVQAAVQAVEAKAPPACPDSGSETILVLEDDPQVRRIIVSMLQTRGYRVLASADERQALAAAEAESHIDMLLSDVVLPQMSGPEVAERLRTTHPDARVLFVSGYTADAVAKRGVPETGASFLQKPFTGRQLGRSVREILDGRPLSGAADAVVVPAAMPQSVPAGCGHAPAALMRP